MNINKLLQEEEILKRKIKRAKRIARIRRIHRIDNYIKSRVYLILFFSFVVIGLLTLHISNIKEMVVDQSQSLEFASSLIEKLSEEKLYKDNVALLHTIDSLQIMIFAYNKRFQNDQKTIQYLLNNYKKRTRVVVFPDTSLIKKDTISEKADTVLVEEFDSIN